MEKLRQERREKKKKREREFVCLFILSIPLL